MGVSMNRISKIIENANAGAYGGDSAIIARIFSWAAEAFDRNPSDGGCNSPATEYPAQEGAADKAPPLKREDLLADQRLTTIAENATKRIVYMEVTPNSPMIVYHEIMNAIVSGCLAMEAKACADVVLGPIHPTETERDEAEGHYGPTR